MQAVEKFDHERRRFIRSLRRVSLYSLISNLCMLALPIFMFNTYRTVIPTGNTSTLVSLFIFALVMLISMGIFDAARQILLSRAATRFEAQMSGYVLAGELNRQHDAKPQTMGELSRLRQTMSSPAVTSLFDLPMVPIFTAILFLLHPALGITLVFGAIFLVLLTIWGDRDTSPYLGKTKELTLGAQKALARQFSMQEYVRSQGLFREALNDWGRSQRQLVKGNLELTNKTSVHAGIAKAARQIFQIILLGVGALLVLAGEADMIIIIAASLIGGRALAPIDSLVGGWKNLREGYNTLKGLTARLEDLNVPQEGTPLPVPKGDVRVHRVTYVPAPGQPPILRGIYLGADAGEAVAIIGPSGAGKSTFAKLLVGYYEPSIGFIKLDGQDLNAWDPIARGRHIGYVPQSVDFFDATIQENIASLRRDDPKEWAVDAAQRAGVHEVIMSMPQGYDTKLVKGGFWPSGGQAQLIALARAFYGDPKLLVLDEPNAALDQKGEQIFHQSLARAKKAGITAIVVSQRPAVLRYMDKVLVLQDGQVKDFGPRDKVLNGQTVRAVSSDGEAKTDQEVTEVTEIKVKAKADGKTSVAGKTGTQGASS